ncbi:MAG: class I SAM-dependent RNA methyltransferase [Gemmatimonadales bacterium]|nr:class I SAM-dependent RNA methyltransferase [Gemmatimonadales bacterium]
MTPVRILRLAAGGDGIGKLPDGRTVFVPRTAPGDLVELQAVREHKRFARARAGLLLEPGADRVEPRCPHYLRDQCGGCQLQHLAPDAQREARRGFVGDAIRRLARRALADPPIVPSPRVYDYRTKITLAVEPGGRRIGLHPHDRPDQVFDLHWCHITVPELMELWQVAQRLRPLFPPRLQQVVLRLDRAGARHLLFRVSGAEEAWNGATRLHAELERRNAPATIWWQPEPGAARAMAGAEEAYPATVFEQVHPEMGDMVRQFAVEALAPAAGSHVWDLYAGIGETTALLVGAGAVVESVESDRRAVAEAEARGPAARRHTGRVEDVLGELQPPDGVITNPPRTGMDQRVTTALEQGGPARLVYVSCDPATLARDLARVPAYRLTAVRCFDLFPQTAHVETVAVLERAS